MTLTSDASDEDQAQQHQTEKERFTEDDDGKGPGPQPDDETDQNLNRKYPMARLNPSELPRPYHPPDVQADAETDDEVEAGHDSDSQTETVLPKLTNATEVASNAVSKVSSKLWNIGSEMFMWIMEHPWWTCVLLVPGAITAVVVGLLSIGAAAICFAMSWMFAACTIAALFPFSITAFAIAVAITCLFCFSTASAVFIGFFVGGWRGLWREALSCTCAFLSKDVWSLLAQFWGGFLMFVGLREIAASSGEVEDDPTQGIGATSRRETEPVVAS